MSLFDDKQEETHVSPDQAFELLTGPGGKFDRTKYKDEAEMYKAMAYGKFEADRTIEIRNRTEDQLREDYKKLREEYNAGPKIKEVLDQIAALKQSPTPEYTPAGNEQQSVLDETKAADLFKSMYQQTKADEQAAANERLVESKLRESYGEDYNKVLRQKVSQLGMSEDMARTLARTTPQALFKALELDQAKEGFQSPPSSSHRTDQFQGGPKRTWSYYQKMRKEDPYRYNDPKTKAQMTKDYSELGNAFEDGDWVTPRYIN